MKLIVIGDKAVGKSCLIQRYFKNRFSGEMLSTLGVNQESKFITCDGAKVKLICYDTAGAEQFQSITQNYYRNADGVLCCYDASDEKTF